ncbi:virion core protein, T7 gp14 family [Pseudomonas sp. GB2N2]
MCAVAAIPFAIMAVGGLMQAQAAKKEGAAAASAALQNAQFSEASAADTIKRGDFESDQQRIQTRDAIGTQRAGFAANGIDVNSGTAANIQDDTAQLGELDALTIKNNAAREAWGYGTQATQFKTSAKNSLSTANSNMFGSLLSSGANGARAYSAMGG